MRKNPSASASSPSPALRSASGEGGSVSTSKGPDPHPYGQRATVASPSPGGEGRGEGEMASQALTDILTRDQAEAAMAIITGLTIQLHTLQARQNDEIQQARRHDPQILDLETQIRRHHTRLELWATEHRATLGLDGAPGQARSLKLRQGTIGFRWSNRAIRFLANWTEAMVMEKLRSFIAATDTGLSRKYKPYIRTKEELDRQQLLKDSRPEARLLDDKDLKRIGISAARTETFFTEPNLEEVSLVG